MTSNIKRYQSYYEVLSDDESVISSKQTEDEPESMEDDVWDDTLLIKAYDKAVMLTKEKIASRNAAEKEDGTSCPQLNGNCHDEDDECLKKSSARKERIKWKEGTWCRTAYSEDGIEYEAVIKSIDYDHGVCTVRYFGYNNEEEVDIKNLKPSKGKEAQLNQKIQARQERLSQNQNGATHYQNGYQEDYSSYQQNDGMIPPPPPPFVVANLPKDETDALSAMLMSWYMSGFHTGYYQGLTRSKSSSYGYRNNH